MKAAATAPRSVHTQRTVTLPKPMQLKCACGASAERSADECEQCSRGGKLQTKLRVNGPGDALEQEADRLAQRVLSMSQPSQEANEASDAHGAHLARAGAVPVSTAAATGTTEAPAIVSDALNEGGTALDSGTRAFLEPRFGHDFSRVRIHTGTLAARSADAVNARAYTVGNDVVFASGEYAPASTSGRKLLAHELSHVLQQQGSDSLSRMPVLQRDPKKSKMGRILSLEDVLKDPVRKGKQKLNQQKVARVYKDTSGRTDAENAPATLATGEQVWIIKTLPGELWMQIEAGAIKGFGPKQVAYVHAGFVFEVPGAVVGEAKSVPAAPKVDEPAKPLTEDEKVQALRASRPAEYRWEGDAANPKTNALINGFLFSKYLWFHAPQYRHRAIDFIEKAHKEYHEHKLDRIEYEKKFGGAHLLRNSQMSFFFFGARDAIKHFKEYVRGANGGGGDERNWNDDIKALMSAEEPIAVLLDGREPGDMKTFGKLRSMLSLGAPKAFVSGVLDGVKSQLSNADYKLLAGKMAGSSMLALPLMPVAAAGTAVGVGNEIYDTLKGLYEMASAPLDMAKRMIELIMTLMMDEDGARQIAVAMGEQEGKEISKLAKEDLITFTYKLYEKVGPLVVSVALSFVTGGSAGAARMGVAFEKILSRSQKARAIVKKIEALLPEKRKLPKLPDLTDHKPDVPKLPDAPKTPDAPKVEVPKTPIKRPNFDDAIAARKWAKETLKLTDETLEGMSPGAYKRLGELPDADLDRIGKLSERARRYLLGCESPCPVEGPDIKAKLGKYKNNQLENLAKARAEKRKKRMKLKKPDDPPPPSEVPDVAPAPTNEWAKKALDLEDPFINNYGPGGIKELFKLAETDLARIRKLPRNARLALLDSGKPGKINLADIEHHLAKFTNKQIEIFYHDGKLGKGVRVKMTDKQHARLRRTSEALEDPTKWGSETDKDLFRLGRKYDETMEVLARAMSDTAHHYVDVDDALIAKLRKAGGKVVITEGKLKGGKHRFDFLQIDFERNRAELLDLASRPKEIHTEKTRNYKQLLEKALGMPVDAKELFYTGPKGEMLDDLIEVTVK